MKHINIFTVKNDMHSFKYLTPLFINRRLLKDIGLTFNLAYYNNDVLYDCDCVIFDNRVYRKWGLEHQDRKAIALLEELNTRVDKVFWLDTTDSTGTTQFHLLPYVDKYFKLHVLKDRAGYLRTYYGGRIYTDYYHCYFGVKNSKNSHCFAPAEEKQLNKIQLFWNASLADNGRWASYLYEVWKHLKFPLFYSSRFFESHVRTVKVSSRFNTKYRQEIISYHRQLVKSKMDQVGIPTEKISRSIYLKELRNSKIGISPFGWGEFCYRDYEIILNGAMLMKPDMSHIETWPNLYIAGETYMPHKWDCSDVETSLEEALQGNKWFYIARNAQRLYRKYLLEREGKEEFCTRFKKMLE